MIPGYYTNTQPLFLPCTYMLHRFAQCEAVIVMEEAQYNRKCHHSRGTIADKNGHKTFSIPVSKSNRKPINEIYLAKNSAAINKLVKTLSNTYPRTLPGHEAVAHVADYLDSVRQQVECGNDIQLVDVCLTMMKIAIHWAGLDEIKLLRSQEILPQRPDTASEWMALLGEKISKKTYYAGETGFKAYLNPADFQSRGMLFKGQEFTMPTYHNHTGEENNAWLAWLDPYAHLGKEAFREKIIFAQPACQIAG